MRSTPTCRNATRECEPTRNDSEWRSHAVWRGHPGDLLPDVPIVVLVHPPWPAGRPFRPATGARVARSSSPIFQGLVFRHDEKHKNESAGWVLAAVRLADGTCHADVRVRPRFGHNARSCHGNQAQWFTTVGEGTRRVVHRSSPHRSVV